MKTSINQPLLWALHPNPHPRHPSSKSHCIPKSGPQEHVSYALSGSTLCPTLSSWETSA